MTAPRQVLRGITYLVTRRCSQRQFLLKPSAITNAVFGYVLAVAAQRFGVLVHGYAVLSNHYHLVLTDVHARLPEFQQYLDALVARALNASYGRWESFWAPSSYSAVALTSSEDVVDKIAYTLANPVAAALVRHGREWPGLWSDPAAIGGAPVTFDRPGEFFRENGPMPPRAELALVPPPGFTADAFREDVVAAFEAREEAARRAITSAGRGFLGRRRVLAQDPLSRPEAFAPRRNLSPRVAARDVWKRLERLGRLKEFTSAYREALRTFNDGVRDVVFPPGTYWMRVHHGAVCASG